MNLVVDVGNTETVLGLFPSGSLEAERVWRISTPVPRTADEYRLLIDGLIGTDWASGADGITRAVLGSVVPAVTGPLGAALERLVGGPVVRIDASTPLPVRLEVDEPRTVGADRIVNTLAASRIFGTDCVVVDLGTATTFDCITADGRFLGGVIAPGVLAGQEWLALRTAKLPRVELRPPERVIGRTTETCLHSGIFYSAVEGIDGVVRRIREEWSSSSFQVVATGGYASVLGPHAATVDRVEPLLTLLGLMLAGEHSERPGGGGLDALVQTLKLRPARSG